MKFNLIILIFSFICRCISAQQYSVTDYRKELNIKLEVIDEKRLDKGVALLNEGMETENETAALMLFPAKSFAVRLSTYAPLLS